MNEPEREQLKPGETLDELRGAGLRIIQAKKGYRFSLDPVLLCAFSRLHAQESAVDLGAGCGVVSLLMARRSPSGRIVGVERQGELAERARRSVHLNALADRVRIVEGDLRRIADLLPRDTFDVVLTNPPFRAVGTGRQAALGERAAARHELAGGIEEFLRASHVLLKEKGRIYLIFLAERLAELLEAMRRHGLEPKRLRCVHARSGAEARMVLVEGRKGGSPGMAVEPPLYVYEGEGYSPEVAAIYGAQARGIEGF